MNDVKRRFFSGDTLQQALVQAANYFNLDPTYVAYRSLEKKHGFLKTRRKVMIEVDPDNPRLEKPVPIPVTGRAVPPPPPSEMSSRPAVEPGNSLATPPASAPPPQAARPAGDRPPRDRERRPEPGGPREDRAPVADRGNRGDRGDRGPRGEGARGDRPRPPRRDSRDSPAAGLETFRAPEATPGALVTLPEAPRGVSERFPAAAGAAAEAAAKGAQLLVRLAGLDLAPRVFQGEERLEVELVGEDVDWCFADDGEFLISAEHLLPRIIRTLSGEMVAVRVDCDNFHEIREERLRSLAQQVAEEVRRGGKARVLEPMNPGDRRIIHTTLADDPNVATESEGDGYFKRIMVRPTPA
jgi:predicted RNA-binding protein Jag